MYVPKWAWLVHFYSCFLPPKPTATLFITPAHKHLYLSIRRGSYSTSQCVRLEELLYSPAKHAANNCTSPKARVLSSPRLWHTLVHFCNWALTCFSSGGIHHCWCCTPPTITKCPCCNPVLNTWYCRADCNSPPSTCIHILSYHWYSKAGHLISSNQCIGYVIIMLSLVFHCWITDSI